MIAASCRSDPLLLSLAAERNFYNFTGNEIAKWLETNALLEFHSKYVDERIGESRMVTGTALSISASSMKWAQ